RAYLADRGIGTQVHYPVPIHLQEAAQFLGYRKGDLPVTERVVRAVHGLEAVAPDPADEIAESDDLRRTLDRDALLDRYASTLWIDGAKGQRARRVVLRAVCKRFGSGVKVGMGVLVLHPHTFEIGDAVFIGNQSFLQ